MKAKKLFKKAISLQPSNPILHNNLGSVLDLLVEQKESLNCYQKAIKLDNRYVEAYINLAMTHEKLKNFQEAKKYYEKALHLNPNQKKGQFGYGRILLLMNQHNKALHFIKKGSGVIKFTQENFMII